MPHYISCINRVKLLFIKTTLAKHRSGKFSSLIIRQNLALRPQQNNINEKSQLKGSNNLIQKK